MNKNFGKSDEDTSPFDSNAKVLSEDTASPSDTSHVIPPRKGGTMSWLPWVILGAILVVLIIGTLILRIKQTKEAAMAGKPPKVTPMVNVEPVRLTTLQQTLQVTGNLRSNQDINLGSKISGRVARVLVKEGDHVKRGQVVVQLDDKDLRAQVDQARAGVLTAQAHVKQAQANYPSTAAQVESGVVQAQSALQQAQAKLRQAQLNEPNQTTTLNSQLKNAQEAVNVSQARVTQAQQTATQTEQQTKSAVASAQANVDKAKANLDQVIRGSREQQIGQAQAAVNLAQAQLNNAKLELDRQKALFAGGAAAKQSVDTAQTNYEVAQAQLESAQQNLSLVKAGSTSEDVRQAQAAYQQAEAALVQAQAGRTQASVAQQDVISAQAQLAQSKAALRTAQANLAQIPITKETTREAREQVSSAQAALRQAEANRAQLPVAQQNISVARAEVQAAQAQLEQAQVNLAYARIASPVDGVVVKKLTNAGETTSPGAALMEIVALNSVYFEAQISETNIASVLERQPVSVSVPSVSPKPFTGYVSEVIPVADPSSRQFRVRVTVPTRGKPLTPGAFARGVITTRAIKNALAVPTDAVHQVDGKSVVYVAIGSGDNITIASRPVKTGMSANEKTQILSGILPGDKVIISQEELTPGAKVQISKFAL
jgi:HlyD family secretion protein